MLRKKILIIDDEKDFTSMLSLNLEATGKYEVFVENNSSNAIETALRTNPDLVLLDVVMPEIDGPDIMLQIRESPLLKTTPVIFLTAVVKKSEVDSFGGKIGEQSFVSKPTSLEDLLNSIIEHIN